MKIWIYECSSGFTSYTAPLSASLARNEKNDIELITTKNNLFLPKAPVFGIRNVLDEFESNSKKNSLPWMLNRVLISLRNILKRNRMVHREKPDILNIQFTIPIIDQFFIRGLRKYCRIVLTAHDVIPPNKSRFWSMRSLDRLYKNVDHIIVHSRTNAKQLMDIFSIPSEKISVIHHGLETVYPHLDRTECRKSIGVEDDAPVFLFYGGIREQKGLDDLIRALKGIRCHLVIAGAMPYGESFARYEELLREAGIHAITKIEFISDEFTNVLFQAADIVALPYKYFYSQSGVFMQAIQYAKYILATDVSSFKEYLDQWDLGCLCQPNDIESIHKAAETLANWIKAGKTNEHADAARDANTWEKAATLHEAIYESELTLRDAIS